MSQAEQIAKHWDAMTSRPNSPLASKWWQSPQVIRHQNKIVCGEPIDGFSAGLRRRIKDATNGEKLARGISVGCGSGQKELQFIQDGLVHSFDLFELSPARIKLGQERFKDAGLSDRANFVLGDAFNLVNGQYDIVYWDSSLHHMMDTREAVKWSHSILKPGGILAMFDYIGPNRFQWSDAGLEWASRVRASLPEHLARHTDDQSIILRSCNRPDPDRLAADDPSEAVDSERIVQALNETFPSGQMWMLGGYIYHLSLSYLIGNFIAHNAASEMDFCLMIDEAISWLGENHYAAFLAVKGQ